MQVNQFAELLKESKPKFFRFWKLISFFVPFVVIVEIGRRHSLQLQSLWSDLELQSPGLLLWALLLMPLNWGLEAYKWHFLMKRFHFQLSYRSAFKTTLTGLAYSLVLPGGIGEYIGRAEAIPAGAGWKGAGVLSIARIAQLYATVLFGGVTLSLYLWQQRYLFWLAALVFFMLVCWTVFLYATGLARWIHRKLKGPYTFLSDVLQPWMTQGSDRVLVFLLSTLRYIVFTFQFYLILLAFGVEGRVVDMLSGISSAFLLKSFFPSFLDLGPRELAVMLFFKELGVSMAQVLSASLVLWFINILLPGLAGSLLTLRNFVLDHLRKKP